MAGNPWTSQEIPPNPGPRSGIEQQWNPWTRDYQDNKQLHQYWDDLTGPEVDEYRARVGRAYTTAPVIGLDGGQFATPYQWLSKELTTEGGWRPPSRAAGDGGTAPLSDMEALSLLANVGRHFAGQRHGDADTQAAASAILDRLKQHAPHGEREVFPGWTEKQRSDSMPAAHGEQRYAISPGMRQNLNALTAYNLLTALNDTPEHSPAWAGTGGALLTIPAALNQGGTPGSDIRKLTALRWAEHARNPASARLKEALYWDDLAQEGLRQKQYRDSMFGGYWPQYSWLNPTGMANQAEYDRSNLMTRFEKGKDTLLFGMPPAQWSGLSDAANYMLREAPVVPEGMSAEDATKFRHELQNVFDQQEHALTNNYPIIQENWNAAMDYVPGGNLLKAKEYSFPSPAWHNAATAPIYWLDAPTMTTLGMAAPAAIASKGVMPVLGAIGADFLRDQPVEQAYGAGLYLNSPPYSDNPAKFFQPQEHGDVTDSEGRPALPGRPGDSTYRTHWQNYQDTRAKKIEELLGQWEKLRPAKPSRFDAPSRYEPKF